LAERKDVEGKEESRDSEMRAGQNPAVQTEKSTGRYQRWSTSSWS
jgi:hypothetical protein